MHKNTEIHIRGVFGGFQHVYDELLDSFGCTMFVCVVEWSWHVMSKTYVLLQMSRILSL